LELFRRYRSLEKVLDKARGYALQAKEYISDFPPGPAHTALMAIPDYVMNREH
jgi:geranylgeranyl pyrophosphate synthase